MLVVLTIISLILGLVGPRVLAYLGDSRVKTARAPDRELRLGARPVLHRRPAAIPPASEGLEALATRPTGVEVWNGPYVKGGRVPNDPWGHAYQYRVTGERRRLMRSFRWAPTAAKAARERRSGHFEPEPKPKSECRALSSRPALRSSKSWR